MKVRNLKVESHAGIVRAHLRLEERVSVIVGGPSSGKTSVVAALVTALLYESGGKRIGPPGTPARRIDVEVEGGDGARTRVQVGELRETGRDHRTLQRILGDPSVVGMLLDPVQFLDAPPWLRKQLVIGSVALDVSALVGRLRALQIPAHHGVVEAMTSDLVGALRRVRDARKAVEGRLVRVSEPEDPLVETHRGTSRVSGLPSLADLEAALTPLADRLTAMGAYLAATPGSDDPVAMAARAVEHLEGVVAARQMEQDALGWTPEDDTRYEARIPAIETAKGAAAIAQARAHAAAESVTYLADLEEADAESVPSCPTCRNQPTDGQRPTLLRGRTAAANELAGANKAVWEATQALKALEKSSAELERRAAAFTVKESETGSAQAALHAARQALISITEHEGERAKSAAEVAALRDRVSKGQALVALRRTYDAARETFEASEALRLSVEAEAQRYRDAEKMLEAATAGRTDLELGGWISRLNEVLRATSGPLFGVEEAVLSMDENGELFVRRVPMRDASSTERFLASIAFGHALAVLSEKYFLVIDGLERAGYEDLDRILAWLIEVGGRYDSLIVTVAPNGVTPEEMADARMLPVERAHVRYYPIDVAGVIDPVAQPEGTA